MEVTPGNSHPFQQGGWGRRVSAFLASSLGGACGKAEAVKAEPCLARACGVWLGTVCLLLKLAFTGMGLRGSKLSLGPCGLPGAAV